MDRPNNAQAVPNLVASNLEQLRPELQDFCNLSSTEIINTIVDQIYELEPTINHSSRWVLRFLFVALDQFSTEDTWPEIRTNIKILHRNKSFKVSGRPNQQHHRLVTFTYLEWAQDTLKIDLRESVERASSLFNINLLKLER